MLNNFIYAQTKDLFLEALGAGNILDEAIVFIEDTKEIWNHGTYFAGESIDPDDFELLKASVSDLETTVENIPSELVYEVSYADLTSETTTQEFYNSIVEACNANKRFRVPELGCLFEVTYLDEYNGLIQMIVPVFEPDNEGAITNLSFFGKQVYSNLETVILPNRTLSFQTSGSGTKFLADNGTYVEPDSTISATSENAVMNKAVANALDEINAAFDSYVTKEAFENEIYYFYPNNATIVGPDSCANPCEYRWETTTEGVNGSYQTQWTLSNDAATVSSDNNLTCVVTPSATILEPTETTLTLTLIKNYDQKVLATASKTIVVSPLGAVITSLTNAPIQTALYSAGLVEHEHYTTEEEAAAITADQLQTGTSYTTSIFYAQRSSITHFEEFEYFTGLTLVPQYLFYACNQMTKISIPKTVLEIGNSAFYNCSYLDTLKIGSQVTTFGSSCFYSCSRIANLYIDNIDWWLLSQMSNIPKCTYTKRNFYILDQDGNYTLTKELEISSSVTSIRNDAFWNTNITSILIPSSVASINQNAFCNCSSLENVYGCSGITSVNYTAFTGCHTNIKLEETVPFGLFTNSQTVVKATSGKYSFISFIPMALMLGETTFYADTGAYFADGTSEKTLTLAYTGGIEDLTDNFIIASRTLTINSNFSDTRYSVSFTSLTDGSVSTTEVGPGSTILNIQGGSSITITPLTTIEDYTTPAVYTTTWSNTSGTLTVTMTYKEIIDVRIQHVNGDLYTTDEWTAGGYSNDNANGVAFISASAAFVIAKTESESKLVWGGHDKEITGIVSTTNSSIALLDFAGYCNTAKIIEQLTGYTDSSSITGAPAAEACANYTFPNGNTGYLGSLGEWKAAYNNKTAIVEAMSLIGGTTINDSNNYWTSTQYFVSKSWRFGWRSGSALNYDKNQAYYVRAFSAISKLTINCNRNDIKFTITYTPWNKDTEKTVTKSNGVYTNILPKKNTTVTISVSTDYDWAELNTYSQTFTYTGEDISATFTSSLEPGAFIQHVNGDLYTTDEWTAGGYSNDDANGVAVIDSNCAFVIAKENASTSKLTWGGYNKTITDVVANDNSSQAVLDFDGKGNTAKIIEQLTGYTDSQSVTGAPAAEACANYTFLNSNEGYLPSLGEWKAVYDNKTIVNEAMSLIGGMGINISDYWTSTQYRPTSIWVLNWDTGYMSNSNKTNTHYVRAFSAL